MPKTRSWTDEELQAAVKKSYSIRQVLLLLNLVPAGGNYAQITDSIKRLNIDTKHFLGKGWNVGMKFNPKPVVPLKEMLVSGRRFQGKSLKNRLFKAGIKKPECELCGWCERSVDGRIPIEIDHINGDHLDNRLENLRILCPNCHSLQPTHRGKNKKSRYKDG